MIATRIRLEGLNLTAFDQRSARVRLLRVAREVRQLVRTASPIAAIGLMNMLLSLTDVVMIGRLDPDGVAAIVIVSDLYSVLFNFTVGFSAVVAPLAATAIGAGVNWRVCTMVQRVMLLVLLLATCAATGVWFTPVMLQAIGLRLDAPETTAAYAHYMAGAFVFMALFAMARHVLSGAGRSRFAVVAIALALPANAVLNYVCMAGVFGLPGLGAAGAGLASLAVAIGLGGSVTLYLFVSRSFDEFRAPPQTERVFDVKELLRLGRQAGLMGFGAVAETGMFLASTLIVGFVAPAMLVAHTLAFRAMAICYLLVAGLGQAATIRIAFLAGQPQGRSEIHARAAIRCCSAVMMALLATSFGLAGPQISHMMAWTIGSDEPQLLADASRLVPLAGFALTAAIPAHVIGAILKARGRAMAALTILALGHWGVGLVAMLLAWRTGLGGPGVWLALTTGALAASTAGVLAQRGTKPARRSWRPGVKSSAAGG